MILYLLQEYNFDPATGAIIVFLWNAISNFVPIFGAFLSDSWFGRYRVIALGTIIDLVVSTTILLMPTSVTMKIFERIPKKDIFFFDSINILYVVFYLHYRA